MWSMDSCEVTVPRPHVPEVRNERTKSPSTPFALSYDGKELYTVQNPTILERDHYRVQPTRLAVYRYRQSGLNAKPIRMLRIAAHW